MPNYQYDYIIAGAGASGLSLAIHLLSDDFFTKKKILIVDSNLKKENDKTWCFWEKSIGMFEPCVLYKWDKLTIANRQNTITRAIFPYQYKMIRSIDFYKYCFEKIAQSPNITMLEARVQHIQDNTIYTNQGKYDAEYIFNSTLYKFEPSQSDYHLLQHFKGWVVKFDQAILDVSTATLMDFDIDQHSDCRFVYVLPVATDTALIEYTVFSKCLLKDNEYENELNKYINQKFPDQAFQITHQEFGVIPMSNAKINAYQNSTSILPIGTAGYATKASTGYTFKFIQKQSAIIVRELKKGSLKQISLKPSFKYRLYDTTLLSILDNGEIEGAEIFVRLFKNLPFRLVLAFLNEETNLFQDFQIMWNTNKSVFSKAALAAFKKCI